MKRRTHAVRLDGTTARHVVNALLAAAVVGLVGTVLATERTVAVQQERLRQLEQRLMLLENSQARPHFQKDDYLVDRAVRVL